MKIVALVGLLLLAAGPALAGGGEKGDWELGVYGGYGWLDDYGVFHPKDHFLYGGRIGYFLSNHWSLEFGAQRLKTETEPTVLGMPSEDFKISSLRLNALYNFGAPGNKLRPFLTAGAGHEKTQVENFGESCDYGWNAGAGFRWFLSPHVNLRMDGRYVRTKVGDSVDESQGNVEATLGLGFMFGGHHHEAAAAVIETPPPAPNRPPTVSCAAERAQILPGETVRITATASDPEGGPLTYAWSTTGGTVHGTDATGTLDFTGATPPVNATVTVRVTDDHGNTATCDASVALMEPVKPAEAVSCTSGEFPRNLARLSNVDKACLDDVAQKLSSDPRGHVIVIGYSDSHETVKGVDQKRADAVQTYLVKERSIDPSRVTVRAAGSTKPLGTDAAANRRVEIWFVPEGAAEPK
jgi:outer membrane protein OmpA-like peptidoglycan-associated protein/opacity protein-like surface antigen